VRVTLACSALGAGFACAILAGFWPAAGSSALRWLWRRGLASRPLPPRSGLSSSAPWLRTRWLHVWLQLIIERAGLAVGIRRLLLGGIGLGIALGAVSGALGALAGSMTTACILGLAGLIQGPPWVVLWLWSRARGRRRRLSSELAPTLELLALELGSGTAPLAALSLVAGACEGELAHELRRILVAAQIAGQAPVEARLLALADRHELPQLAALAAVLASSRDYGAACRAGVRALADGVRRAQREELIAFGRRSLNRVLIPAALGVLLPFMALLLYPAVSDLSRSLR